MTDVTETAIWHTINELGWYYWGLVAAMAAVCLAALYRLPATNGSLLAKSARVSLFIGLILISFSWFNTAFGPLASPFLLFGLGAHLHSLRRTLEARGMFNKPEGNLNSRIYQTLMDTRWHSPARK